MVKELQLLSGQGNNADRVIPTILSLQSKLADPQLCHEVYAVLEESLSNPTNGDSVRSVLALILGTSPHTKATELIHTTLRNSSDQLAPSCMISLLMSPFDPEAGLEHNSNIWKGLLLEWWAASITNGQYFDQAMEKVGPQYSIASDPFRVQIDAFRKQLRQEEVITDSSLRELFVIHLRESENLNSRILALRLLDSIESFEELALQQILDTTNPPLLRKVAIEQADLRHPTREKKALIRSMILLETDPTLKATMVVLLSHYAFDQEDKQANFFVFKELFEGDPGNAVLSPTLLRSMGFLDTKIAVEYLSLIAEGSSYPIDQRINALNALNTYSDATPLLADRFSPMLTTLFDPAESMREAAALLMVGKNPNVLAAVISQERLQQAQQQLQDIRNRTKQIGIRIAIDLYLSKAKK